MGGALGYQNNNNAQSQSKEQLEDLPYTQRPEDEAERQQSQLETSDVPSLASQTPQQQDSSSYLVQGQENSDMYNQEYQDEYDYEQVDEVDFVARQESERQQHSNKQPALHHEQSPQYTIHVQPPCQNPDKQELLDQVQSKRPKSVAGSQRSPSVAGSSHASQAHSQLSQHITYDPAQSALLYNQLIATHYPSFPFHLTRTLQRKRTLLLWLKAAPDSQKEIKRDNLLRKEGYMVFSSAKIDEIIQKYEQRSTNNLPLQHYLLFSQSAQFNTQQAIIQLKNYFIDTHRISELFLVKPVSPSVESMKHSQISGIMHLTTLPYQLDHIKTHLSQKQNSVFVNSVNFTPLKYWDGYKGLDEQLSASIKHQTYRVKSKICINGCLTMGKIIIERALSNADYFKQLAKQYTIFHDQYLQESNYLKQLNKSSFMEKVGKHLLQDPIGFYLTPTHELTMNRIIKMASDQPAHLTNIILPLSLLFYKIRDEYRLQNLAKKYKSEIVCHCELQMTEQELSPFQTGEIVENTGIIKAHFNVKSSTQLEGNVRLVIRVPPSERQSSVDNGFLFIEGIKNLDASQTSNKGISKSKDYQGFSYLLINLLNSFKVLSREFDVRSRKEIIQLEYGYISAQQFTRKISQYIPQQGEYSRYIRKKQEEPIDYPSLIKSDSNSAILGHMRDFGDMCSLVGQYGAGVKYYQELFKVHKTVMKPDAFLLALLQSKKGWNYEREGSPRNALDYYYNAFNFIHKGRINVQLQEVYLRVMKCLKNEASYEKLINYTEGIIKNARMQENTGCYKGEFMLRVYGFAAEGHFYNFTQNYEIVKTDKRIQSHIQAAKKVIQDIGEYNQLVPQFYLILGRYLLANRQYFDGLVYLNKALLVSETIKTEHHPDLGETLLSIATACTAMHDYPQAYRRVKQCVNVWRRYYPLHHKRLIVAYEMRAKIAALLSNHAEAVEYHQLVQECMGKVEKKKFKERGARDISIKTDQTGWFTLIEQKELQPYFGPQYRENRGQICLVYTLIYQSALAWRAFDYSLSSSLLEQAYRLNIQEMGDNHRLNLEIPLMSLRQLTQTEQWEKAQTMVGRCWGMAGKMRREKAYQGWQCHLAQAQMHFGKREWQLSQHSFNKVKELAFALFGKQSLEHAQSLDNIGRVMLEQGNIKESGAHFEQSYLAKKTLKERVDLNPARANLPESQIPAFLHRIRVSMGVSMTLKASHAEYSGQYDMAFQLLNQSLEYNMSLIGEYQPTIAQIYLHLSKVELKRSNYDKAQANVSRTLAIHQQINTKTHPQLIEVHLTFAQVKEASNQLGGAVEQMGKTLQLMRSMNRIGKKYEQVLDQMLRVVDMVLEHPDQKFLKTAYFAIAKLYEHERDREVRKEQVFDANSRFTRTMTAKIRVSLQRLEMLRIKICEIEGIEEEKPDVLTVSIEQTKNNTISLENIKQKVLMRRKMREDAANH